MAAPDAAIDCTLSALAHPVRRAIVERLLDGELTVGAIAAPYEMKSPTISRHLKVLEGAGLIERRVAGRQHHCRLNPRGIRSLHDWLDRYQRFWSGQLDELERFIDEQLVEELVEEPVGDPVVEPVGEPYGEPSAGDPA